MHRSHDSEQTFDTLDDVDVVLMMTKMLSRSGSQSLAAQRARLAPSRNPTRVT
jgi:hypothetical protein